MFYLYHRGEFHDDPNQKRSMVRSVSASGGYSGTGYDRWSYEQSARAGAGSNDTPLNKLQYKYWVMFYIHTTPTNTVI